MSTGLDVYHSFDDVPVDDPPESEGDDSIHAHDLGAGHAALAVFDPGAPTTVAAPHRLVVPHPRDLKKGDEGWDVLALHRALSHAGFHKWNLRNIKFGPTLEADLKKFQKHEGIAADGVYGKQTHAHLAPHYTAFEINLILQWEAPHTPEIRAFLAACMALYNMRYRVHYTQGPARMFIVKRRIKTVKQLAAYTSVWEDCSSSLTGTFYMAGCPDPNGLRYCGLGYTGTLAVHGKSVPVSKIEMGALCFYGRGYPWTHVTGVVSAPGKPIRVFSHGSESGPLILDVDYRGDIGQARIYPGMSY
jgi:hypothetical protein